MPEPHIRDHWAGYRFSPFLTASTQTDIWVADTQLPLIVSVDKATGRIGGLHVVPRPAGGDAGPRQLCVHAGEVWAAWGTGVVVRDIATGRSRAVDVQGSALRAGSEGVWTLTRDAVVRLDRGTPRPVDLPAPGSRLALGCGAVWVLSWVDPAAGRTVLHKIDAEDGGRRWSIELEGSPQSVVADASGVWVDLWVREGDVVTEQLIGIDPDDGVIRSSIEMEPVGALQGVVDGVAWQLDRDRFEAQGYLRPTTLRGVSAADGMVVGEIALPGVFTHPMTGDGRLTGCLHQPGGGARGVVEIDTWTHAIRHHLVDGIDVSAHLPPPPAPIVAEDTERQVCDDLARSLLGGRIRSIDIEVVRLEGSFPDTEVVAYFRSAERPGFLFARKARVWAPDGALLGVDLMDVHLMEDVEACGYGLPLDPEPDASGIVWF